MKRSAFTLIEVLLSVAILGLVATTVALVLAVGTETWRATAEMAEETHDGDAVMEQIVMALRSAYCAPASGSGGGSSYDYGFMHEDDGEEAKAQDIIEWTKIGATLVGEDVPWAGSAHRVRLFCSQDEDGQGPGLYAKAWQLVGEPEDFDPEDDALPVLLSDRVIGLDCRMLDPEKELEPGDQYEWIDEWTESNRVPDCVRISIALKPHKKGADPDVLVRLVEIPMSKAPRETPTGQSSTTGRIRNGEVGDGFDPDVRVTPIGGNGTIQEPRGSSAIGGSRGGFENRDSRGGFGIGRSRGVSAPPALP